MNNGNLARRVLQVAKSKIENDSAGAAARGHARMEHFDSAGRGALAKTGDHGVQKAGKTRHKKRAGEGEGHALMRDIAFANRLGMSKKKPREHSQDPAGGME